MKTIRALMNQSKFHGATPFPSFAYFCSFLSNFFCRFFSFFICIIFFCDHIGIRRDIAITSLTLLLRTARAGQHNLRPFHLQTLAGEQCLAHRLGTRQDRDALQLPAGHRRPAGGGPLSGRVRAGPDHPEHPIPRGAPEPGTSIRMGPVRPRPLCHLRYRRVQAPLRTADVEA